MNVLLVVLIIGVSTFVLNQFVFKRLNLDKIFLSCVAPLTGFIFVGMIWMPTFSFIINNLLHIKIDLAQSSNIFAMCFRASGWLMQIVILLLWNKFILKLDFKEMKFHKKFLKKYLIGILIGIGVMSLTFIFMLLFKSVKFSFYNLNTVIIPLIIYIVSYAFQGLCEEISFRGMIVTTTQKRFSNIVAFIVSGVLFSFYHAQNPNLGIVGFTNITLIGFILAIIYIRFKSIWLVGAIHSFLNFTQGQIFGSNVSGNHQLYSLIKLVPIKGKTLFNGGLSGFEGSISLTLSLVIFVIFGYMITMLLKNKNVKK